MRECLCVGTKCSSLHVVTNAIFTSYTPTRPRNEFGDGKNSTKVPGITCAVHCRYKSFCKVNLVMLCDLHNQ